MCKKGRRTMENKLYLNIGNGKNIVVEHLDWHDEFPNELSVYICDENNVVLQDICLVRQHYEYDKANDYTKVYDKIDCMVWADCGSEDYTHKFVIDQWKEDED
jgi:hypothetical protein